MSSLEIVAWAAAANGIVSPPRPGARRRDREVQGCRQLTRSQSLLSAAARARPSNGDHRSCRSRIGTLGQRVRRATLTAALTATAPAFGTPAWLIRNLSGRAWTSTDAMPAPFIRGLWARDRRRNGSCGIHAYRERPGTSAGGLGKRLGSCPSPFDISAPLPGARVDHRRDSWRVDARSIGTAAAATDVPQRNMSAITERMRAARGTMRITDCTFRLVLRFRLASSCPSATLSSDCLAAFRLRQPMKRLRRRPAV